MKLPQQDDLMVRETLHGSSSGGGYYYRYEDAGGLGIVMEARKPPKGRGRSSVEERHWSLVWLPDKRFATYEELCQAVADLTDEDIAREKARFPCVSSVTRVDAATRVYINGCRLCPRPIGERGIPGTHDVVLEVTPDKMNAWRVSLCDAHLHLTKTPVELLAALKGEVEARRLAAAERRDKALAARDPDDSNYPF